MKKIYVILSLLVLGVGVDAQTVSIIQNLGTSGNIVVGGSNYHASESIYTETEIGGAGNFTSLGNEIEEVSFFINAEGVPATVTNFSLYMRNVPAATTTFATGTYSLAGYTLVYNGNLDISIATGGTVVLTTPFLRTAGSNLQILIVRTDNVAHTGNVFFAAVGNNVDPNALSSRRYNNTTAPVPGVTSLTASAFRPAIQLVNRFAIDAGVRDIITPSVSCYNSTQTFGVEIANDGTSPIAIGAASVTLKVRGINTFTGTQTNTAVIAPGATQVVNFSGINVNNAGVSDDTAYVNLPLDGTTSNDSLFTGSITATTLGEVISTYPLIEDAETTLPVFSYIELISGTTQLWTLNSGNYQNVDMDDPLIPRAPGTIFYLFDSYDVPSIGFESRLYSNCIKMPSTLLPNPAPVTTLSFWMSRDTLFNADGFLDSLYVSVSTDKGQTWTRLLPGYQRNKAAGAPSWEQKLINLSAYNGQTIQIGFEGASDWGNAIGLDDINVSFSGLAPVTILNFDARKDGAVNKLSWSTSQEVNSDKFVIERSNDGRTFTEIGMVAAAGNSTDTRQYRFTDPSPVKGTNQYRLRIVDLDNSFKYSIVRTLHNLTVGDLTIAPNPVQQNINIIIDADRIEKGMVVISDLSGKRVSTAVINVTTGRNTIEVPAANLAAGSYMVTVYLNNQTVVRKINKM